MTTNERIKVIKINGIKTTVILPKGIEVTDVPKRINTDLKEVKGLVCML